MIQIKWLYRIIINDFKKLIGIIYTNKIHLFFSNLSLKNFKVKVLVLEQLWNGLFFEKFLEKDTSKNKIYKKFSYLFVG